MANVQSHPDDHPQENMVTTIRVVLSVAAIIPLVICLLRLYIRRFILQSFGWDDIFVIPALIGVLGWEAFTITQTFDGLGRHMWDVDRASLPAWFKGFYIAECTYPTVSLLVKISAILFLMRIFPEKKLLLACKSLIAFLVVFTISGTLVLAFQCQPIRAAYTPGLPGSKCFSADAIFGIFMYQAVTMFVTDVIIIVMPMPIVWKLKLPLQKRIAVIILFALGLVATIASLVRFSTLAFVKNGTDYSYTAAKSYIWMAVEFSLGLATGSLSSLRPILTWKGVGLFSSMRSHYADARTYSKSRHSPRSNGYTQQDYPGEIELSQSRDRNIIKTTIVDVEFGSSESTEHIVKTVNPPVH